MASISPIRDGSTAIQSFTASSAFLAAQKKTEIRNSASDRGLVTDLQKVFPQGFDEATAKTFLKTRNKAELILQTYETEQLIKSLGKENYRFLIDFLQKSFNGTESIQQLKDDHAKFVQIVDRIFEQFEKEHPGAVRDYDLWTRFEQDRDLDFTSRVGRVQALDRKLKMAAYFSDVKPERESAWLKRKAALKTAAEFRVRLAKALPPEVFSKEEIDKVVDGYFARFSQGLTVAQESDLQLIKAILERRFLGTKIAETCIALLGLDKIDSAHQRVRDKGLLLKAQEAQMSFDRYLQKLKRLDAYHLHLEKGQAERQLFEDLKTVRPDQLDDFKASLPEQDQFVVAALQKRQKKTGAPFQEIVNSAAKNADRYIEKIKGKIKALQEEIATDDAARRRSPRRDYIDPNSYEIQLLLLKADRKHLIKSKIETLKEWCKTEPSSEQRKRYADLIVDLTLWGNLSDGEEKPVLPFFNDYCVFPVGNVIQKDGDGKWIVIDLNAVAQREKQRVAARLTPAFLEEALRGKKPYETLSFDTELNADRRGSVKIFYEPPSKVFLMQEDRDFEQRTRLVLDPASGNHDRIVKDLEASWRIPSGWNPGRKRTAAVDRLEAVWLSRLLLKNILLGKSDEIVWNTYQHLSDYFSAVQASDLAGIDGGYLIHSNFEQAVNLFGVVSQSLVTLIKERLPAAALELKNNFRNYNLSDAVRRCVEIVNSFQKWIQAIDNFLKNVPAGRESQYIRYTQEFEKIRPALVHFLENLPEELRKIHNGEIDLNQKAGEMDLAGLIRRTVDKLDVKLNALSLYLTTLATAEASPAIKAEMGKRLGQEAPGIFTQAANLAIPNCFKLAVQTEGPILAAAESISELSELGLEIRDVWAAVAQRILEMEALRSKERQSHLSEKGREKALNDFFNPARPTGSRA